MSVDAGESGIEAEMAELRSALNGNDLAVLRVQRQCESYNMRGGYARGVTSFEEEVNLVQYYVVVCKRAFDLTVSSH